MCPLRQGGRSVITGNYKALVLLRSQISFSKFRQPFRCQDRPSRDPIILQRILFIIN